MEKGRTRTRRVIPVQVLMVLTTAENAEGEPYNKRKFIGVFPTRDEAEEAGRELDLEELRMEGASLGSTADLFAYCRQHS